MSGAALTGLRALNSCPLMIRLLDRSIEVHHPSGGFLLSFCILLTLLSFVLSGSLEAAATTFIAAAALSLLMYLPYARPALALFLASSTPENIGRMWICAAVCLLTGS